MERRISSNRRRKVLCWSEKQRIDHRGCSVLVHSTAKIASLKINFAPLFTLAEKEQTRFLSFLRNRTMKLSWFKSLSKRFQPGRHVKLHPRATRVDESEVDVQQVYRSHARTRPRDRQLYGRERMEVRPVESNALELHAELVAVAEARIALSKQLSLEQIERLLGILQSTRRLFIGDSLPDSSLARLALDYERRLQTRMESLNDSFNGLDDEELTSLILSLERYLGQKALREVNMIRYYLPRISFRCRARD